MAEEKGAFRHIVLLKVGKKEDVGEVVKTLSNMGRAVASHVSILSFDVTPDMGKRNFARFWQRCDEFGFRDLSIRVALCEMAREDSYEEEEESSSHFSTDR